MRAISLDCADAIPICTSM